MVPNLIYGMFSCCRNTNDSQKTSPVTDMVLLSTPLDISLALLHPLWLGPAYPSLWEMSSFRSLILFSSKD